MTANALVISPNGRFLQEADGAPFFWLADTAWELLHRLKREDIDEYLNDRASRGFNVIQLNATGKVGSSGLIALNRYGELPFRDLDPTLPNERYFELLDWTIDRASALGLRIALVATWGQATISGPTGTRVFTVSNAETYGRWLGSRYGRAGLIWMLGGDVVPLWPSEPGAAGQFYLVDYRPVHDAMAKGIKEGAGAKQIMGYHPCAGSHRGAAAPRTSLYFADSDWLDLNMIQSGHFQAGPGREGGGDFVEADNPIAQTFFWNGTFNYLPISREYASRPVRPIIDVEPCYEAHPILRLDGREQFDVWAPHHARNALYQALFAGAAGHTYGHFSVWDFHDLSLKGQQLEGGYDRLFANVDRPSWREALSAEGGDQMRHAKQLMLTRSCSNRVPDQTLVVGEAGEGAAHIAAMHRAEGGHAMVYIPDGRAVAVDTRTVGDMIVSSWFDPRTGKTRRGDVAPASSATIFTPPTRGFDQDWVLILEAR